MVKKHFSAYVPKEVMDLARILASREIKVLIGHSATCDKKREMNKEGTVLIHKLNFNKI